MAYLWNLKCLGCLIEVLRVLSTFGIMNSTLSKSVSSSSWNISSAPFPCPTHYEHSRLSTGRRSERFQRFSFCAQFGTSTCSSYKAHRWSIWTLFTPLLRNALLFDKRNPAKWTPNCSGRNRRDTCLKEQTQSTNSSRKTLSRLPNPIATFYRRNNGKTWNRLVNTQSSSLFDRTPTTNSRCDCSNQQSKTLSRLHFGFSYAR